MGARWWCCGQCLCDRSNYGTGNEEDIATVPAKLLMTMTDVSDDCSSLDGFSLILESDANSPGSWLGWVMGDCQPCLTAVHVQSAGLGADLAFAVGLSCGNSLPCDLEAFSGFVLSFGYAQIYPRPITASTRRSIQCPTHPWQVGMTDAYRCESHPITYEVDPDVVPCSASDNSPHSVSVNVEEPTCNPLKLVFDYESDMTAAMAAWGETLEYCGGEDCEPCCFPCTYVQNYDGPGEPPPESAPPLRICHVKFRAIVTKASDDAEDPCA